MTVLIAGGGIAGLTLALTCRQIGVDVRVFESVRAPGPLGVGINLQPNAVRELDELGLVDLLPAIGVETREFGLYSTHGLEIWREPRGRAAGYRWPQYSVHRGELQMALWRETLARLPEGCVVPGARAMGWEERPGGGVRLHLQTPNGPRVEEGDLLIGADGLHSAIRASLHPTEGPPIWSGCVLWRAAVRARPFRHASMAVIGSMDQRFVTYTISPEDPQTGEALVNWIAELRYDASGGWTREDWNREVAADVFLPQFEDWDFGWIDCPGFIRMADRVFEYPMVDRDPLPFWTQGPTTLIGDAAHIMWPVGSNGASQGIMDARKLGRAFLDHGATREALLAYEAEQRPAAERMILAARAQQGPDALLGVVQDRSGGRFDSVDDVVPTAEMAAWQDRWKGVAGLARETLNGAPPVVPV